MKIYLAATAPGNEERERKIKRLLSYFLIVNKMLECDKVFNRIKNENIFSRRNDCN